MGRAAAFGWVGEGEERRAGWSSPLAAASTPERRIPPFHVQMGMASTGIGKNWYYSSVGFKLADWRPTDTETRDNGAKGRPSKSRIDSYANWSATQHHRRWPASKHAAARPPTDRGRGTGAGGTATGRKRSQQLQSQSRSRHHLLVLITATCVCVCGVWV